MGRTESVSRSRFALSAEEVRLTAGAQQEEEDPDYQQEEDSSIADCQREENRPIVDTQLYLCSYCRKKMKIGEKPARCVLNGLQIVAIPPELAKLDSLSTQFIQLAKSFQTIVRLGTYMGKVPSYNSLKACKGTMFFLPLPHNTTIETLKMSAKLIRLPVCRRHPSCTSWSTVNRQRQLCVAQPGRCQCYQTS